MRYDAMRILRRLGVTTTVVVFLSLLLLVLADSILFTFGTWNGWSLTADIVAESDRDWWLKTVRTVPRGTSASIPPPEGIPGHHGTWYWRTGGTGSPGVAGTPTLATDGLVVYDINSDLPLIRGRALASEDMHGYHVGVALPAVMIERRFIAPPGISPPHPDSSGWQRTFRWAGLTLNVSLISAVFLFPLFVLTGFRLRRLASGRCVRCAHILLSDQVICPECGHARLSMPLTNDRLC